MEITWNALKKSKDVIIKYLRMYFSNPENYKNLLPPQISIDYIQGIEIYDIEPDQLRQFPLALVTGSNGNMITGGLGDMATEIYNNGELVAYRYGGMYEFNITIEIGTRQTLEREVLSDLITSALRFTIRRKIEAEGVLIKNISYGGESTLQYDSNHIYVSTINLSTWSEWYYDFSLLPVDNVNVNQQTNNK